MVRNSTGSVFRATAATFTGAAGGPAEAAALGPFPQPMAATARATHNAGFIHIIALGIRFLSRSCRKQNPRLSRRSNETTPAAAARSSREWYRRRFARPRAGPFRAPAFAPFLLAAPARERWPAGRIGPEIPAGQVRDGSA